MKTAFSCSNSWPSFDAISKSQRKYVVIEKNVKQIERLFTLNLQKTLRSAEGATDTFIFYNNSDESKPTLLAH